jgi:hypothetical protein
MKKFLTIGLIIGATLSMRAQPDFDYSRIGIYVTPFYNSEGPKVEVGRFSAGLASRDENTVLATIADMRKNWHRLGFPELYVAAIRLYDLGYRQESIYWFYSAQYRGRQFAALLDQKSAGGIGSIGFELFHAQNAFYELSGPYFNGYAFGDPDRLVTVVKRVQEEGRKLPELAAAYPGVRFIPKDEWEAKNTDLANRMAGLIAMLQDQKDEIRKQRAAHGIDAKTSKLTNRELPRP